MALFRGPLELMREFPMSFKNSGLYGLFLALTVVLMLAGCAAQSEQSTGPETPQQKAEVVKEEPKAEVVKEEPKAEKKRAEINVPGVKQREKEEREKRAKAEVAKVEKAKVEKAKKEAAAAKVIMMKKPEIDTSVLPPSRGSLDTMPDLYAAEFAINKETIANVGADLAPREVMDVLNILEGQTVDNAGEMVDILRAAVGRSPSDDTYEKVLRNTLLVSVDMASPSMPKGDVDLVAAEEAQKIVQVMVAEPKMIDASMFKVVFFNFDKSNIKPEFQAVIAENAKLLIDNPDLKIAIEGHCDERGTTEYNLALGERRANAVRTALIGEGVEEGRLITISYGEERPADSGSTEEAWAKNRRSVLNFQ